MPRPAQGVPMPRSQRQQRDRTKPVAPDGSYLFRIDGIRDEGWKPQKVFRSGDQPHDAPVLSVRISADHPDGTRFTLYRDVVHSYDPRSTLCLLGKAVLGIDPGDPEVELDYRQLIGGQFLGEVKSRDYHPKDESSGLENAEVTHYWTEWKGAPLSVPAAMRTAAPATQAAPAQSVQQPPPRDNAIAIPGSFITTAVKDQVGPVIRRVLDAQFGGDAARMHAYFNDELARDRADPLRAQAECALSFVRVRPNGQGVFNFDGRTDTDMEDLGRALVAYEAAWADAPRDVEGIEADDLPF